MPAMKNSLRAATDDQGRSLWRPGGPFFTVESLVFTGGLITDAVRTANVDGDGLTPPAGVGIWGESEDLNINGGFETNPTGWTGVSSTITRITTDAKFGDASGLVTVSAAQTVFTATPPLTTLTGDTTGLVFSGITWVRGVGGTIGKRARLVLRVAGGATAAADIASGPTIALTADWQPIFVTGTIAQSDRTNIRADVRSTTADGGAAWAAGDQCGVDGAGLYAGPISLPFVETDGNTETRAAGAVSGDSDDLGLDETQGAVAIRYTAGIANTALATGDLTLFQWGDDSDNELHLRYDLQNNRWEFTRRASGSGTPVTVNGTFIRGTSVTVIATWTPTTVALSINGANFVSQGNTTIPTLTSTDVYYGTEAGAGSWQSGQTRWSGVADAALDNADAHRLDAIGDEAPTWTEARRAIASPARLTALWQCKDATFQKAV